MTDTRAEPGALLRARDDTLFFVPLADLLGRYRLPDDQQRGSVTGDGVIAALDGVTPVSGLKNAILSDRLMVVDLGAEGPAGGKQRFAAGLLEAIEPTAPGGGKQRFAAGLLDTLEPGTPSAGKQRFAAEPGAA